MVEEKEDNKGLKFAHIDLFSGIGGFAFGFQKAGLNVKERKEIEET